MGRASSDSHTGLALLTPGAIALVVFAATCFTPALLGDGDSWWHLRAGEWMLEHRAVPMVDAFSYTFAGQPWHAHEWLAELVMALVYRLAGWGGVTLLCAAAVATAIALLHDWVRRFVSPLAAFVGTLLAFGCLGPGLLARPHLLVWPLLVLWMRVLLAARERDRAPSPWWLLLVVVWANMHGTALAAAGLVGVFALEALVENPREWQRVVRQWAPFGIGAGAALLVNPRGLEGVVFLIELTRMESLHSILEWQPPDFSHPSGLAILLLAGLFVLLSRGVRIPPVRLILLLALLHMTLLHQRHQMLLGVIGVMLACEAMGRSAGAFPSQRTVSRNFRLGIGLALLGIVALRLSLPVRFPESESVPEEAFAAVPAEYRKLPVLNLYGSGGYLIGQGVRPFIDGRTDLYGDAFVARYNSVIRNDPGALDKALAEYRIAWTFLSPDSPAAMALDSRPGWRRAYADRWLVVHLRDLNRQP